MISEEKHDELYRKARLLLDSKKSFDFIHENLLKSGSDVLSASEIIKEVKLISRAQKRQQSGIILLSGGIILLAGFLLLLSEFFMQTTFTYIIYGFTSVGFVIICYGLYKLIY